MQFSITRRERASSIYSPRCLYYTCIPVDRWVLQICAADSHDPRALRKALNKYHLQQHILDMYRILHHLSQWVSIGRSLRPSVEWKAKRNTRTKKATLVHQLCCHGSHVVSCQFSATTASFCLQRATIRPNKWFATTMSSCKWKVDR